MKERMLSMLVSALLSMMSEDMVREFADRVLDFAEEAVARSSSTLDDKIVLPICTTIRATFGIPDND